VHLVGRGTPEEDIVARLVARHDRAREALEVARSPATDEHAVTLAIVGGRTPPAPAAPPVPAPLPPVLLFPSLADAAREEARRIATSRALQEPPCAAAADTRPAMARLRCRAGCRPRCYWAVRVPFVDAASQVCWSTVAAAETRRQGLPADGGSVRVVFDAIVAQMQTSMRGRYSDAPAAAAAGSRAWTRLALRRERDIARDVRRTRARLAALQPGLFDRRTERDRAAQAGVLDEALERCAARIVALERMESLTAGPLEPLFAVLIG
jgi:hypothetical protein